MTEVALRELVRLVLAAVAVAALPSGDYLEVEERVRRVMAALATAPQESTAGGEWRIHRGATSVGGAGENGERDRASDSERRAAGSNARSSWRRSAPGYERALRRAAAVSARGVRAAMQIVGARARRVCLGG